jgi:hypothetical protein
MVGRKGTAKEDSNRGKEKQRAKGRQIKNPFDRTWNNEVQADVLKDSKREKKTSNDIAEGEVEDIYRNPVDTDIGPAINQLYQKRHPSEEPYSRNNMLDYPLWTKADLVDFLIWDIIAERESPEGEPEYLIEGVPVWGADIKDDILLKKWEDFKEVDGNVKMAYRDTREIIVRGTGLECDRAPLEPSREAKLLDDAKKMLCYLLDKAQQKKNWRDPHYLKPGSYTYASEADALFAAPFYPEISLCLKAAATPNNRHHPGLKDIRLKYVGDLMELGVPERKTVVDDRESILCADMMTAFLELESQDIDTFLFVNSITERQTVAARMLRKCTHLFHTKNPVGVLALAILPDSRVLEWADEWTYEPQKSEWDKKMITGFLSKYQKIFKYASFAEVLGIYAKMVELLQTEYSTNRTTSSDEDDDASDSKTPEHDQEEEDQNRTLSASSEGASKKRAREESSGPLQVKRQRGAAKAANEKLTQGG